ncbi:MAG: dihydrofolate reductase [Parcubacteria group bacterium]|nr:dihydrofolate reductase [Parcubacteria group bacterium]
MKISIVVAMDKNRAIGYRGKMPWCRLSLDMRWFKAITIGSGVVIMGRKTYESIGQPLSGRVNVVVTRQLNYKAPHCIVVNNIAAALQSGIAANNEICVIGGAEIFQQTLDKADKLYITQIHEEFEGDVYFPFFEVNYWKHIFRQNHKKDNENPYDFTSMILEKIK